MSIRDVPWAAILGLAIASATIARAGEELSIGRMVGQPVGDFTLKDATTGEDVSLDRLSLQGEKVVLFFIGVDCPASNGTLPRLVELADAYQEKGVAVLAIDSNAPETAERVASHAKQFGLNFPVLTDPGNVVADRLLVGRTCETLLIDRRGRLRYRGAFDDQFVAGKRRDKASKNFLIDALDAVLEGREVETTATTAFGCPIARAEAKAVADERPRVRTPPPAILDALREREGDAIIEVGEVTYAGEVAAILQARCQACHRPKQAAPFSLLSYDDARRWSATIKEVVEDRRMPPWHADPRFGHFENDRSLTPKERATILAWVGQGTPLGDPKAVPPAKEWPDGWSVGTPDVVIEMPDEYVVPAQGEVEYQYFRVPTGFTEDRWVQSIECRPGDRAVVHHIIAYLDDKKPHPERRGARGGPGIWEHLGAYAPGDLPSVYAPGTAKLIPAGSDVVFQVHYTPMGRIKADRSRVGFVLAKSPPSRRAITLGIANGGFAIPPNDGNYEVKQTFPVPAGAELLSFMPHMHLRGKDFLYAAVLPDGTRETLLSIPAYDFAWQSYYLLDRPRTFPEGTSIECVAHFDNSADNPYNPDPSKTVHWGDQTWQEMMIGYIDLTFPIAKPGGEEGEAPEGP